MNLAPLSDCKQRNNGLDNIMLITYNLIYIYGIANIHTPPNHIKMWVLQKKIHFFIFYYILFDFFAQNSYQFAFVREMQGTD